MSDCRCGNCGGLGRAARMAAQMGIDCSDEAQARRDELIENLENQLFSGVTNVSDRGRSVSYVDGTKLIPLIQKLRDEKALCMGYLPSRGRRYFVVPLVKDL